MNKYQEALNKIVKSCCPNCNDEKGCSSCDIEKTCNCTAKSWVNTLQELVDKETPKKVIIKKCGIFNIGDYYCPHCNHKINEEFEPKHCHNCGQKLDWSDE